MNTIGNETQECQTRFLTGITTTGIPHLGNYVSAIKPAVINSTKNNKIGFFFLADCHALTKCRHPSIIWNSSKEIAAAWIAAGIDYEKSFFYRQSDVPEIMQLYWLLTCVASKGLMNRAHAYKTLVEENRILHRETDYGINMGLFSYPILMASDILIFNAHEVAIGQDQIQHIEIARDIANTFNKIYGENIFVLPRAIVNKDKNILGTDGRKMSKSYNNIIPLFNGGKELLKSKIMKIMTNSQLEGEPKNIEDSTIYSLYCAFSSDEDVHNFRRELESGLSWKNAKLLLYQKIESELSSMREHYSQLIAEPSKLENILKTGSSKVRPIAVECLKNIKSAVGLNCI